MGEYRNFSDPRGIRDLMAACKRGNKDEVTSCLGRILLKGNLCPKEASFLCENVFSNGFKAIVEDIIRNCDVKAAQHSDIMRMRKHIDFDYIELPEVKVWIGGTVSFHPLVSAIEIGLLHQGLKPRVRCGGFDTLHHDFLNAGSDLYKFNPDFVVLAYDLSHLAPEVVAPRQRLSQAREYIAKGVEMLQASLTSYRARSSAGILIHTIPKGDFPDLGYCDWVSASGNVHLHMCLNQKVTSLCQEIDGVYVVDLAKLAEEIGLGQFRDERRRFYGSFPASADAMVSWGTLAADCISTIKKGPRKVIVLDLDGTLWGGIVGEVGPLGVDIGPQYPGNAYVEFQRNLLDLKNQGILLSVCSKNDPEVALSVFRSHPHMPIHLDDIVSYQIGWDPKPKALMQIALDLNLGLDSFVFLDDSPHERAAIRQTFPEVLTPDLPRDPVDRPAFLKSIRELWPLSMTESDSRRTELYSADKRRKKLQVECEDYSSYLINLEQVLQVGLTDDHEWKRVAQMHVRTNQFNMTTRRYNETDLRNICSRGGRIYVGSLEDCFGNQGIVVTAVIIPENGIWRLDSFLMSCRVMSRGVEASFLKYIVSQAESNGVHTLLGEYIPTDRNKPAADFYRSFGFTGPSVMNNSSSQWWELDVELALPGTSAVRIVERSKV